MQEYSRTRSTPGARGTRACSGRGPSRTSPPSSASTSRCRSTPAASASSPAITSRARRISASRSSASASTTTRATSGSGSTSTAGSTRTTSTSIIACPSIRPRAQRRPAHQHLDRDAHRPDSRPRVAAIGRPEHAAAARFQRRGQPPEDRELTARLYGGDQRVRIRQELLLGVGGVRALDAMGIVPGVVHLNEGHSAFAALELVRQRMVTEGISRRRGDSPRGRSGRLHDPHAGAGGPRPLLCGPDGRAPRPAARIARAVARQLSWGSGA